MSIYTYIHIYIYIYIYIYDVSYHIYTHREISTTRNAGCATCATVRACSLRSGSIKTTTKESLMASYTRASGKKEKKALMF